jgi:hypothetical protein
MQLKEIDKSKMITNNTMQYAKALKIAETTKALLSPYCERIGIAGSIRRKKPDNHHPRLKFLPPFFFELLAYLIGLAVLYKIGSYILSII